MDERRPPPSAEVDESRALCVDLDGTLVSVDTLHESLLKLVRTDPTALLRLPGWVSAGRAQLKQQVASRAATDASRLPYREDVVAFLRREKARGRRIVLATASDERTANAVAEHLGLFDDVIASNGVDNLKGARKLAAIRERLSGAAFDYVGDSQADLPVWEAASRREVVAPSAALSRRLAHELPDHHVLVPKGGSRARALLRALRPVQWSKNLLLFVPMLTSHRFMDGARIGTVCLAFVAFCLVASAGYVLNDLLDLEADRRHPTKRLRPFAAGRLSAATGCVTFAVLLSACCVLALACLPGSCSLALVLYLATTLCYSFYFKSKLLVDVIILAGLYTLRVLAGGMAADIRVSEWLLAFAMFMFLSLAVAKRYAELRSVTDPSVSKLVRRGYRVEDTDLVLMTGMTSGFLSVLVFSLYINSSEVELIYERKELLWFASPVILYWILRIWFLARRGELPDDPVAFAMRDRNSILAAVIVLLIVAVSV